MTDFKQRIAAILPQDESMRRLIHNTDGNLAIMTSDEANCLGFFDPAHPDACGQMAQVIDAYNDTLPLLQEMQAEIERLRKANDSLIESDSFLSALMSAGVDSWDGYETAIEMMEALQ